MWLKCADHGGGILGKRGTIICKSACAARRVVANATREERQNEGEPIRFGRRRVFAILETAAELVAASTFEIVGRPVNSDFSANGGPGELILSLLPRKTPPDVLREAENALSLGELFLSRGDAAKAVQEFDKAVQLAPWQYKLAQRALLMRIKAYEKLGTEFSSQKGEDFRKVWLWGRGVRWPGWYFLSYIFFRKAFVPPEDDESSKEKAQNVKNEIPKEWFLVIALVAAYNYLLITYGLEY